MRTATLEIDLDSGAGYLRLRDLRVTRTEVIHDWPLLAVDFSATGVVIGVEAVGSEAFDLQKMLKAAQIPKGAAADYRLKVVTKRRELATA